MGTARQYHSNGIIGRNPLRRTQEDVPTLSAWSPPKKSCNPLRRTREDVFGASLRNAPGLNAKAGPLSESAVQPESHTGHGRLCSYPHRTGKERDPAMTARAGDILRGGFCVRIVYH